MLPSPVRRALVGAALVLASVTAAHANTRAARVASAADLVVGPNAQGQVGDYVLENERIRVIVDDIPHAHGFADTGGNVIDAAPLAGQDRFASLFTMFDNHFGRQGQYDTVRVVAAGGAAQPAQLRVSGVDSEQPSVLVVTDYTISPNESWIRIDTTLTNTSAFPITQLQVGDAIQWGLTTHFAPGWDNAGRNIPGDGHDIGGKVLDVDWAASDGLGSSYGYGGFTGTIELANGSTWSDGNVEYLDIAAGASKSYSRVLLVGDGSISSVSDDILRIRATPTGTLSGHVTEIGTGRPIADATVTITTVQCLGTTNAVSATIARSAADGSYSALLAPGSYKVMTQALGRTAEPCASATITASATTTHDVTLGGQGLLDWTCTDGTQQIPFKVSLLNLPLTERREGPQLGDAHALVGGYAALSPTGAGEVVVAPGSYQVWVTHGMEWTAHVEDVTIPAGGRVVVAATLSRVVDSTGYVSADLHVHAFNSADSGVTFELRAQQAASEGLEIVVPTDHDYISDMTAAINATSTNAWVGTFPGDEVTTVDWGHFNAYPLTPNPTAPRGGALDHAGLSPGEMFAALRRDPKDPVVQVNHPRAGGLGYFDLSAVNAINGRSADPQWSSDFDAVEVFNGKRLYQVGAVLHDWYNMLNDGMHLVGMGNTDTHQVFSQEIGYPRNFVQVGVDDPSTVPEFAFRDAVRQGHTFFTNGPFVETWVDGQGPGNLVDASSGNVDLRVRVQAPDWVAVDTVNVIVNGQLARTIAVPAFTTVVRFDDVISLPIDRDSWIAVEVKGGQCEVDATNACIVPGCPGRLDPVIPPLYGTDPVCPYAHSNPTYVDRDGDGVFTAPGSPGLHVEPIAEVRPVDGSGANMRLNEIVTVRGVVTVPSYTFDHRSNLVYFQDESMDTSRQLSGGISIYQNGLIHPDLHLGDVIEVTGLMTQFYGLTEMEGPSVQVLESSGPVPDPIVLTVSDLRNPGHYEQWEGMLVRINGCTITGGTWPSFGSDASITIRDASGAQTITMRLDGDTDIDGSPAPAQPFDLIAIVGQFCFSQPYLGFYQLMPRQRIDIIEPADPLRILHGPAVASVSSCEATIQWYTTKPGDSVVEYGTTPALGSSRSDPTLATSHSVRLTGLAANTTYSYRVLSGGVASPVVTFRTTAGSTPQFTVVPTVELVSGNLVQVRWQTDIDSTTVVDYGLTTSLGSTATGADGSVHLATLTGLSPGTTYVYQVQSAATACGGGTATSALATFTTPTCGSQRPPSFVLAHPDVDVIHVEWERVLVSGTYTIERATGDCGSSFSTLATVPASAALPPTYDDRLVVPGVTYCYRILSTSSLCTVGGGACSERACASPVGGDACPAGLAHPVISQIQHGGSAGGCDEFVELYNPTSTPYSLAGHALRYQSAANSQGSAGVVFRDTDVIGAHAYLLVATGVYSGSVAEDVPMTCGLSATGGHLSLVRGTTDLDNSCPPSVAGATVIDRVGWGTASCPEGTACPAFLSGESLMRLPDDANGNGLDTDDNAADFVTRPAGTPRNSAMFPTCRSAGVAAPIEVSHAASGVPLLVSRDASGSLVISFQEIPTATGYSLYDSPLTAYGHGGSAANACDVATLPDGAGRRRVGHVSPTGNRYFLVTAWSAGGEGVSGARSDGREIPASESSCAP